MTETREEKVKQIQSRLPDLTERQLGLVLAAIQGMKSAN